MALPPEWRHQARLTRDSGYSSHSQDDRGRVWAIRRGRFVRLTRAGLRIGAPFSANVGKSGNVTAYGPWEAQVSPNGKRIAYSKHGSTAYADPSLSPRGDALAFAQDTPGKRADGVYVWSLRKGCTGTAKRIASGAVDPDWGPR